MRVPCSVFRVPWGRCRAIKIKIMIKIMIVGIDGDAEAFAAEHEPDDAQFPIFELTDLRMWSGVEIDQRSGADEIFSATWSCGKKKWNIGDLFSEHINRAINPDDLLIGIAQSSASAFRVITAKPGGSGGGKGLLLGARDVESEDFHNGCCGRRSEQGVSS